MYLVLAIDSTLPGAGPDIAPLVALGGQTVQLEVGAGAAENWAQNKTVTSRIYFHLRLPV